MSYIYRWAEKLDRLTTTATKDPEGFVGHPVNAFKLMKRLNTEWSELENLVLKDMSDGKSNIAITCRNPKVLTKFSSQDIKVFNVVIELLLGKHTLFMFVHKLYIHTKQNIGLTTLFSVDSEFLDLKRKDE